MREGTVRRVLAACLWAWPRRQRDAHGPALLETAARLVAERAGDGRAAVLRELVAEGAALVGAGLKLRWEATRRRSGSGEGGGWMSGGWTDARYALRTLARSPGFTAVAVLTLALGIGANAAVFSLVDGLLLRPPPYERPDELVLVWNTLPGSAERVPVSGPDAAVVEERSTRLARIAFTIRGVDGGMETSSGDAARHVRLAAVTPDFFDVLGARAALGRTFDATDGPDASERAAQRPTSIVLSSRFWRDALAADPAVVGSDVRINGTPATVVGVMPPDFRLVLPPDVGILTDVDAWLPLSVPLTAFHREDRLIDRDADNTGALVARLAHGATLEQARQELDRIAAELRAQIPSYAAARLGFDARPLQTDATAHARPVITALTLGVAAVLLVACLNIATLLLARGMRRDREFAVRSALGAGRGRLVRQLLAEGTVLAALGAAAAVALAALTLPAMAGLAPPSLLPTGDLSLDLRALGFMAALAGLAALLFGVLPGLQASAREARGALSAGMSRPGHGRSHGRSALVVAQVALSVVLVLGAALLVRTVGALRAADPGFVAQSALTFKVSLLVPERFRSPALRARVMSEIGERVGALPGVRSVGLVGMLPMGGDRWTQPYGLPGQAESEWDTNRADFRVVSSGYFDAMGVRLLEGRAFTAQEDLAEDERVVVVDRLLAGRIAPGGSALDAVIGVPVDGAAVAARVVGVVEHVRHERLERDGREAIYVPYRQEASREVAFVVRTAGAPEALGPAVRRAIQEMDPQIPVYDLATMDDYVDRALAPRSFALTLLLAFAALGLLCAAVGLYGVVALDVSRRTREIGLRLAVGASRGEVVRGVVTEGLRLAGAGVAAGVLLSLVTVRGLRGLVYGVGGADPTAWAVVIGVVAAVALLATLHPALRASRLDPTAALRVE